MLVNDWMSSPVKTVEVSDNLYHAIGLMKEYQIGTLPVMEGGKLVGIVTDRDLKRAAPSDVVLFEVKDIFYNLAKLKISQVMTPDPIVVRPDTTIEEVARLLRERNISACPVIDRTGSLAGVITKNDILKALESVSGTPSKGMQFGVLVKDSPGAVKEILDIVRKYGARLVSVLTTYEHAPRGFRNLYVRVFCVNREKLSEMRSEIDEKAKMIYVVDYKDSSRETYASY